MTLASLGAVLLALGYWRYRATAVVAPARDDAPTLSPTWPVVRAELPDFVGPPTLGLRRRPGPRVRPSGEDATLGPSGSLHPEGKLTAARTLASHGAPPLVEPPPFKGRHPKP
jgi:hypothetical protein